MRRKGGKIETRGMVPEEDRGDVFYKSTVPLASLASKGTILFNFKGTTSLDGILAIADVSRTFGVRISARWARADYHGVKHAPEPGFDHLAVFSGRPDLGEFLWKDQVESPIIRRDLLIKSTLFVSVHPPGRRGVTHKERRVDHQTTGHLPKERHDRRGRRARRATLD